ncbi:hypothetical protein BJV77DRAFT_961199 [Russula vinacea]|nr:hypothetical protein BJV77DRAFT_961199 [Russula vinacea]
MSHADRRQPNDFSPDPFLHYNPHQHAWVPPAPANGQLEGDLEDTIPPPVSGVAGPGRVQHLHHFGMACHGVVDYPPQPIIGNTAYAFPDVGHAQDIPALGPATQFNTSVNPERNPFGYVPQHNAPDPVQSAFPHSHWVLTPNQAGAENLRRLASRYLHHPDAQVAMVSMEAGAAGRYKIVITIGLHDVL